MFFMFGGSHIHEGLYVEWLWAGRYEPKVTAPGQGYRKGESRRRETKDEDVKSIVEKNYFCMICSYCRLIVLEKRVGVYFNPCILTMLSWTCSISITWQLVVNEILGRISGLLNQKRWWTESRNLVFTSSVGGTSVKN